MGKKVWAGVILVAVIAIICVSAAVLLQNGSDDDNTEPVLADLNYEFNMEDMTAKIYGISNGNSATKLIIPETVLYGNEYRVTSIADNAFRSCNKLTGDLVIPDSIESIGKGAFFACTGFDSKLTLGSGLRMIGEKAFTCCGFKGDLTIPKNVKTIGDRAFELCEGFDGILTIGNKNCEIGKNAFTGCNFKRVVNQSDILDSAMPCLPSKAININVSGSMSSPLAVPRYNNIIPE